MFPQSFPARGFPSRHHGPVLPQEVAADQLHRCREDRHRGEKATLGVFSGSVEGGEKFDAAAEFPGGGSGSMGKPWENHGKMMVFDGIVWDLPSGFTKHGWKIHCKWRLESENH